MSYKIVVELQARDSGGVAPIVANWKRQLGGLNTSVGLNTGAAQSGAARLSQGLAATQSAMRAMQSQATATNTALAASAKITIEGSNALAGFAAQSGLAARRFAAFTASAGAMALFVRSAKEGIRAAVDFDLAMNKIAQVSGDSKVTITELKQEITNLSTSLGVSSQELANAGVLLKQAGLSTKDVKTSLEAIALADLSPSFENMTQTSEGLIASFRQFGIEAKQFKALLGSIGAVAGDFAVESSDLITAIQKTGGAFANLAGDSKTGIEAIQEMLAMFTSVRATTRESADSIATGLRTIFTRLQRPETSDALKQLGVDLRYSRTEALALGNVDLENKFVGATEAVKRLSAALKGIDTSDIRYSQVVEVLGGQRQVSRVIPLLKQQGDSVKALNTARAGEISLEIQAEKRKEALANRLSALKEEYLGLFRTIADSKGFQVITESLMTMAKAFAKVLEFASPLLPILASFAAVKIGQSIGTMISGFGRGLAGTPTRRNTGGIIPGNGNTDTVPAYLTPGEFVIRKDSAKKIGYDKLHELNTKGRVGYKRGGVVELPRNRRATKQELMDSIDEDYPDVGAGHGIGYAKKLASSGLSRGVLSRIPSGSRYIGSGITAVAFRTPDGEVIRVQPKTAKRMARERMAAFGRSLNDNVLKTDYPEIEGVIQPIGQSKVRGTTVTKLPYASRITKPGEYERATSQITRTLANSDYKFIDQHSGNLGIIDGKPVVIDPGAVGRHTQAKTQFVPSNRKAGGGLIELLSSVMKAGGKLEHYVGDVAQQGVQKLPAPLQKVANLLWGTTKAGTKAAFSTYIAGQSMVEKVSRAITGDADKAKSNRNWAKAIDLIGAKAVPAGLAAVGLGGVGLAASMLPVGSSAYLAYSALRYPGKVGGLAAGPAKNMMLGAALGLGSMFGGMNVGLNQSQLLEANRSRSAIVGRMAFGGPVKLAKGDKVPWKRLTGDNTTVSISTFPGLYGPSAPMSFSDNFMSIGRFGNINFEEMLGEVQDNILHEHGVYPSSSSSINLSFGSRKNTSEKLFKNLEETGNIPNIRLNQDLFKLRIGGILNRMNVRELRNANLDLNVPETQQDFFQKLMQDPHRYAKPFYRNRDRTQKEYWKYLIKSARYSGIDVPVPNDIQISNRFPNDPWKRLITGERNPLSGITNTNHSVVGNKFNPALRLLTNWQFVLSLLGTELGPRIGSGSFPNADQLGQILNQLRGSRKFPLSNSALETIQRMLLGSSHNLDLAEVPFDRNVLLRNLRARKSPKQIDYPPDILRLRKSAIQGDTLSGMAMGDWFEEQGNIRKADYWRRRTEMPFASGGPVKGWKKLAMEAVLAATQLFGGGDKTFDEAEVLEARKAKSAQIKIENEKRKRNSSAIGSGGESALINLPSMPFAKGGGVGTDTVPALLTPGEFVIKKDSAEKIGYGNLHRMNKHGDISHVQRYATGGVVRLAKGGRASKTGESSETNASDQASTPLSQAAQKLNEAAKNLSTATSPKPSLRERMQQIGAKTAATAQQKPEDSTPSKTEVVSQEPKPKRQKKSTEPIASAVPLVQEQKPPEDKTPIVGERSSGQYKMPDWAKGVIGATREKVDAALQSKLSPQQQKLFFEIMQSEGYQKRQEKLDKRSTASANLSEALLYTLSSVTNPSKQKPEKLIDVATYVAKQMVNEAARESSSVEDKSSRGSFGDSSRTAVLSMSKLGELAAPPPSGTEKQVEKREKIKESRAAREKMMLEDLKSFLGSDFKGDENLREKLVEKGVLPRKTRDTGFSMTKKQLTAGLYDAWKIFGSFKDIDRIMSEGSEEDKRKVQETIVSRARQIGSRTKSDKTFRIANRTAAGIASEERQKQNAVVKEPLPEPTPTPPVATPKQTRNVSAVTSVPVVPKTTSATPTVTAQPATKSLIPEPIDDIQKFINQREGELKKLTPLVAGIGLSPTKQQQRTLQKIENIRNEIAQANSTRMATEKKPGRLRDPKTGRFIPKTDEQKQQEAIALANNDFINGKITLEEFNARRASIAQPGTSGGQTPTVQTGAGGGGQIPPIVPPAPPASPPPPGGNRRISLNVVSNQSSLGPIAGARPIAPSDAAIGLPKDTTFSYVNPPPPPKPTKDQLKIQKIKDRITDLRAKFAGANWDKLSSDQMKDAKRLNKLYEDLRKIDPTAPALMSPGAATNQSLLSQTRAQRGDSFLQGNITLGKMNKINDREMKAAEEAKRKQQEMKAKSRLEPSSTREKVMNITPDKFMSEGHIDVRPFDKNNPDLSREQKAYFRQQLMERRRLLKKEYLAKQGSPGPVAPEFGGIGQGKFGGNIFNSEINTGQMQSIADYIATKGGLSPSSFNTKQIQDVVKAGNPSAIKDAYDKARQTSFTATNFPYGTGPQGSTPGRSGYTSKLTPGFYSEILRQMRESVNEKDSKKAREQLTNAVVSAQQTFNDGIAYSNGRQVVSSSQMEAIYAYEKELEKKLPPPTPTPPSAPLTNKQKAAFKAKFGTNQFVDPKVELQKMMAGPAPSGPNDYKKVDQLLSEVENQFGQNARLVAEKKLSKANFGRTTLATRTEGKMVDGQFQEGEITGGLIYDRAKKIADERVKKIGGGNPAIVSETTKQEQLARAIKEQENAVTRELISAQKALVKALYPNITSMEQGRIAQDRVNQMLAKTAASNVGTQASISGSGALLGDLESVQTAGYKATGQSRLSKFGNAIAQRYADFKAGFQDPTTIRGKLGSFSDRIGTRLGTGAFAIAAPVIGQTIQSFADKDAQTAVAAGRTGRFQAANALSGGMMGAASGAAMGFALGGAPGAVAGAVVFGLTGLVSSLKEAASQIRQVEIGKAMDIFADRLNYVNNLSIKFSASGTATINNPYAAETKSSLEEARAKIREESLAGATTLGLFTSESSFKSLQEKNTRETFAPQLGNISGYFSKQMELLAKNAPSNADPKKVLDDLMKEITDGGDGLNREFINLMATIRKLPMYKIVDELKQNMNSALRQAQIEKTVREARSIETQANQSGRLLLALQSAADSILYLQQKSDALSDAFDGTISQAKISTRGETFNQLGRIGKEAEIPLNIIEAIGGQAGAQFKETGKAIMDVASVLPSVLGASFKGGGQNASDFETEVSRGIAQSLGYELDKIPPQIQTIISSVKGGLTNLTDSPRGIANVMTELNLDPTALTEKLLESAAKSLKEVGPQIAALIQNTGNEVTGGLASVANRLKSIRGIYEQLEDAKLSTLKQRDIFEAENKGLPGSAATRRSLEELNAFRDKKQQDLVGAGVDGASAESIGKALQQVREQLPAAIERQQKVAEDPKQGVASEAFRQAAQEVVNLKSKSEAYVTALQNLTNATGRAAEAQDKIAQLRRERDSRLSFVERYLTAAPEEKMRLQQGAQLGVQMFKNGEDLANLPQDMVSMVLDGLAAFGDATIAGQKASDIRTNLLSNAGGPIAPAKLTKEQQDQMNAAQGEVNKANTEREKALTELAKNQGKVVEDMKKAIVDVQTKFFTELKSILAAQTIKDAEANVSKADANRGLLKGKEKQAELLSQAGITTDVGVARANKNQDLIRQFSDAYQEKNAIKEQIKNIDYDKIESVTKKGDYAGFNGTRSLDFRKNSYIGSLKKDFKFNDSFAESVAYNYANLDSEQEGTPNSRRQLLTRAITNAYNDLLLTNDKTIKKLGKDLENIKLDPKQLSGQVDTTEKLNSFLAALKTFSGDETLSGLPAKVDEATKQLQKFRDELENLKKVAGNGNQGGAVGQPAQGKAGGGTVFKARGTDTVPAMLTPGEFVINKKSAQANSSLLNRINSAKGPVYLAEGGTANKVRFNNNFEMMGPEPNKQKSKPLPTEILEYYRTHPTQKNVGGALIPRARNPFISDNEYLNHISNLDSLMSDDAFSFLPGGKRGWNYKTNFDIPILWHPSNTDYSLQEWRKLSQKDKIEYVRRNGYREIRPTEDDNFKDFKWLPEEAKLQRLRFDALPGIFKNNIFNSAFDSNLLKKAVGKIWEDNISDEDYLRAVYRQTLGARENNRNSGRYDSLNDYTKIYPGFHSKENQGFNSVIGGYAGKDGVLLPRTDFLEDVERAATLPRREKESLEAFQDSLKKFETKKEEARQAALLPKPKNFLLPDTIPEPTPSKPPVTPEGYRGIASGVGGFGTRNERNDFFRDLTKDTESNRIPWISNGTPWLTVPLQREPGTSRRLPDINPENKYYYSGVTSDGGSLIKKGISDEVAEGYLGAEAAANAKNTGPNSRLTGIPTQKFETPEEFQARQDRARKGNTLEGVTTNSGVPVIRAPNVPPAPPGEPMAQGDEKAKPTKEEMDRAIRKAKEHDRKLAKKYAPKNEPEPILPEGNKSLENTLTFLAKSDPLGYSAGLIDRVRTQKRLNDEKSRLGNKIENLMTRGEGLLNKKELTKKERRDVLRYKTAERMLAESFIAPYESRIAAANTIAANARSSGAMGIRRPGDEGQINIAGRIADSRAKSASGLLRLEGGTTQFDFRGRKIGDKNKSIRDFVYQRYVKPQRAIGFATGGMVGGTGSGDIIPAMLTPGEFVLNKDAVARTGVQNLQKMNDGGQVGQTKSGDELAQTLNRFVQASGGFGEAADRLAQSFVNFVGVAQALASAIEKMPTTLSIKGEHNVNVNINGAEVMSKLTPDIQNMVTQEVKNALGKIFDENMPEAGIRIE
jgi:hypothetical protein